MKNKKQEYNWEEFDRDVSKLAKKIEPALGQLSNIYGVPRGGLVVAICLSHRLRLPVIIDKERITERTLIVDDIADSGKTLEKILNEGKAITTAVLWFDFGSKIEPQYYVNESQDIWIIFPWETKDSSKYDGTI